VISIVEVAKPVRDILSPHKSVHVLGQPDPCTARNRYVPDIRKTEHELGLNVTVPCQSG